MKKTLIALMALAGVAFGADRSSIQEAIAASNYTLDDTYTLTFTIDSGVGDGHHTVIKLTDNWTLNTEIGRYLGFSVENTNGIGGNLTGITNDSRKNPFVSEIAVDAEGWVFDSQSTGNLGGVVLTLSYGGGDTTSLKVEKNGATWIDATITSAIDLNDVSVGSAVTGVSGVSLVVAPIPEPTTATLSLLALAGLAARRRRK